MNDFSKHLKLLDQEDIVWYIYFFIIVFALFTNKLEKEYIVSKNKYKKKLAQNINTTILIIAFFIYLYFLSVSYNSLKDAFNKHNLRDERIGRERLVVSILFLVAGAIAIYVDYDDNSTNTDIGIL